MEGYSNQSVCVCVLSCNLGECFVLLPVEPIAEKNIESF